MEDEEICERIYADVVIRYIGSDNEESDYSEIESSQEKKYPNSTS